MMMTIEKIEEVLEDSFDKHRTIAFITFITSMTSVIAFWMGYTVSGLVGMITIPIFISSLSGIAYLFYFKSILMLLKEEMKYEK